jgi:hypothetical protein
MRSIERAGDRQRKRTPSPCPLPEERGPCRTGRKELDVCEAFGSIAPRDRQLSRCFALWYLDIPLQVRVSFVSFFFPYGRCGCFFGRAIAHPSDLSGVASALALLPRPFASASTFCADLPKERSRICVHGSHLPSIVERRTALRRSRNLGMSFSQRASSSLARLRQARAACRSESLEARSPTMPHRSRRMRWRWVFIS